ncbi:hypothetical protein GOODEAATRI_003665, partial [Goodea atripinnis]
VEGQEAALVVSAQEIRVVAELLQVSPESLQKADTVREKIYTPLTLVPINFSRHLSMSSLFALQELQVNSFEQLCINFANETLQFYFNRVVFQEEQEEYMREQIQWQQQPFSNNQACLDLIAAKPYGILRILDDQCGFPQKCHYHHGNDPLYAKPKMPLPEFTLKHYAGKVTYQMVSSLFLKHSESLSQQRSNLRRNSTARRHQANTVSAKFQSSLQELLGKMERFKPEMFDMDLVNTQLLYCGIMETIRIRKQGYPARLPFHSFLSRLVVDKISTISLLFVTTGINLCYASRILCQQMEKIVLSCFTNSVQSSKAHIRWGSVRRGITRFEARCRGYLARIGSIVKL